MTEAPRLGAAVVPSPARASERAAGAEWGNPGGVGRARAGLLEAAKLAEGRAHLRQATLVPDLLVREVPPGCSREKQRDAKQGLQHQDVSTQPRMQVTECQDGRWHTTI